MAGAPFYVKYTQRALTCESPKHVLIVGKEIVGLRIMTCITVRVADIIGTNDVGTGKNLGIKSRFIGPDKWKEKGTLFLKEEYSGRH